MQHMQKAHTQMNLQLANVISDVVDTTGQKPFDVVMWQVILLGQWHRLSGAKPAQAACVLID